MKIFKKIFTALASLAMFVAPVVASGAVGAVKPVTPNTVIIKKQVEKVTKPVDNTFNFVIEQDTAKNPATVTGVPTTFDIRFNNVVPNATTNVAEQTYTLDFSNVDFPKVGDYWFKITEATTGWSTDKDNVYPRDTNTWWAYVSVRYETDNNPTAVSGTPTTTMKATVAQNGYKGTNGGDFVNPNPDATPAIQGNKEEIIFKTTPGMTYIQVEKKVTGNLGDITKYFEYTVKFNDAKLVDKKVDIVGTFSINGTADATSPSEVTVGDDGTVKFYLKHGQVAKVGLSAESNGFAQIPLYVSTNTFATYEVTETIEDQDLTHPELAYKVFIDGDTAESTDGKASKTLAPIPADFDDTTAPDTAAFNTNNVTKYVNNKEADPITGLFINYWPFMLLITLGIIGMIVMKKTSRKNN